MPRRPPPWFWLAALLPLAGATVAHPQTCANPGARVADMCVTNTPSGTLECLISTGPDTASWQDCELGVPTVAVPEAAVTYQVGEVVVCKNADCTDVGRFNFNDECTAADAPWDCCTGLDTGTCYAIMTAAGLSVPGGFSSPAHGTNGACIALKEGVDDGSSTVALCVRDTGLAASYRLDFPIMQQLWDPYPGTAKGTNNTSSAADTCTCRLLGSPLAITNGDTLRYGVSTLDADDVVQLAIYDVTGATRYFKCTADVTSTSTNRSCANTDTTQVMLPGEYWWCYTSNNVTKSHVLEGSGTQKLQGTFTQACSGGTAPATLTAPTPTWSTGVTGPWFMLGDG